MSRKKSLFSHGRAIAELTTLCLIPALIFGCSSDSPESQTNVSEEFSEFRVRLKSDSESEADHTDLFVFNDDELRRIDSYQRVSGLDVKAASRVGDKLLVAVSNSTLGTDDWRRISSYDSLMEEISLLSDEDPECPVMTGQTRITAGEDRVYDLKMDRLLSRISVRTLCADFHTTEYDGEPLTDVRIYLTNVNASCAIMKEENFRPEMIVNFSRLDSADLKNFRFSEMLCHEIPYNLTSSAISADISLCCYPNDAPEETYGSPFTRLVIEGRIRGETCYYPITVNREEDGVCFGTDGSGIGRNCLYSFDITVCRFGTSDPDTPVRKGDVIVNCTVEPWNEKDSETIIF